MRVSHLYTSLCVRVCVRVGAQGGADGTRDGDCSSRLCVTVIVIPADIPSFLPPSLPPHPSIPRGPPELFWELRSVDAFSAIPSITHSLSLTHSTAALMFFQSLGAEEKKKGKQKGSVCVYSYVVRTVFVCQREKKHIIGGWKVCWAAILLGGNAKILLVFLPPWKVS